MMLESSAALHPAKQLRQPEIRKAGGKTGPPQFFIGVDAIQV
jgi:hypothetical protein